MTPRCRTAVALLLTTGLISAAATAQSPGFEAVDNPFQREYDYRVGEDLRPGVQVEGLNWYLISVSPRDPDDVRPGRSVTSDIRLGFENTTDGTLNAVAVILFEDAQGNGLDRAEIDGIRVPPGDSKVIKQKEKLQSDLLLATRRLYVFWEVQP
jgi:hypothetical protein